MPVDVQALGADWLVASGSALSRIPDLYGFACSTSKKDHGMAATLFGFFKPPWGYLALRDKHKHKHQMYKPSYQIHGPRV